MTHGIRTLAPHRLLGLGIVLTLVTVLLPPGAPSASAAPPDGPDKRADFEGGAPAGFFVFSGGGGVVDADVATVGDSDPAARPAQSGNNGVLAVDFDIPAGGFGGFGAEDADPVDWSTTDGFSFWFLGSASGATYRAEIFDNGAAPGDAATSQRFDTTFADDSAGWTRIVLPWTQFARATGFQPGGAPDDGELKLTETWGWAIGLPGEAAGAVRFDDVGAQNRVIDEFAFDGGLPQGVDGDGVNLGFHTFQGGGATSVAISAEATPPAPEAFEFGIPASTVRVDMNLGSFAGFVRSFANDAMDAWVSQDWSDTEGVAFWLHGQNSGTNLFFEVLENRNPGSTTDDAERWTYPFADDFTGWRYFEIPFSDFVRKDIGNGAPNDGFTREEVHGWAFGADTPTGGDVTWHMGQVSLFGVVDLPMRVGFTSTEYDVAEGADATVVVRLNQTSETATVSVDYASVDLHGGATPDADYTPVSGTLTFPPGNREQTFQVSTFGNGKYTGDRRVILQLSSPVNAELDFVGQAAVRIIDAETFDPNLVDDFEDFPHLWDASANVALDSVTVAAGDALERPDQAPREGILVAERSGADSAALWRDFPLGRDWSLPEGLTFWHHGEGTGDEITVTLKDNRADDPGPAAWELVWSDEFDGPAGSPPDPEHWTHEIGDGLVNGLSGWGNSERQYYTDSTDNAAHDGAGNLVITADEADGSLVCYYGPCEYTSARLLSQNKVEFAYGRIAASIKVPEGDGWWPAFWALGTNIGEVGWPQSGEIDIMEFVGRQPQIVHGTIHGPGYSGGQGVSGSSDVGEPVGDEFREFAVEWAPDRISWLLDGVEFFSADPGDASGEWVFNSPFFLLLNLAVGGTFPGPVGEDTVFPQEMVVEYVRVYQGPDTAERFEASFTDDESGWRQVSIPFSDFARSAEQPAGAPNDGLGLSEAWGYGFALPADGDLDSVVIDGVELVAPSQVVVTSAANSGPGSLRSAIAGVSAGGTITFDPALGGETIALTSGALTITKDMTIDADDAPGLRISGNGTSRVFVVNSGVTAEIGHVEVVDGVGAVQAGGILNNGTLTLDHVVVSGNEVTGGGDFTDGGGGIYNGEGAVLNLIDSTVSDNTSSWVAGGIYSFFGSTTNIIRSTISGNTAADVAGGLRILGDAHVVNSTISGNTGPAWHGGAIFHTDGEMRILNSTIAGNISGGGTAAVFVGTFGAAASLTLENSIVAGNAGDQCVAFGGSAAALDSLGGNMASDASCSLIAPGDQPSTDPLLAVLADNGGPTRTHALTKKSPALGAASAASCPATDQRGIARPQGKGCDSGAFERVETGPGKDKDKDKGKDRP